jgi:hypothetical protein
VEDQVPEGFITQNWYSYGAVPPTGSAVNCTGVPGDTGLPGDGAGVNVTEVTGETVVLRT